MGRWCCAVWLFGATREVCAFDLLMQVWVCSAACTMRGDSQQRLHLAADQKQAAARTSDLTILLACAWLGIMRCAKPCLAMMPRCSCCKAANHGPSRDDAATRARERAVALPSALTAQRRISLATDGRACACTFAATTGRGPEGRVEGGRYTLIV